MLTRYRKLLGTYILGKRQCKFDVKPRDWVKHFYELFPGEMKVN
jgi:hypothetical protein